KMNKVREARQEYAKVADFYAKDGFLLKAIAIWRKINKLDTSAPEPYLSLADLYATQGLMMESKSHYQLVVDESIKRDKPREAAAYLEEALKRSPNAPQIFARLGEAYLGAKKIEEAEAIFKRLLALNPDDDDARAQMARVHLQQGQFDHAFDQLQPGVNRLIE